MIHIKKIFKKTEFKLFTQSKLPQLKRILNQKEENKGRTQGYDELAVATCCFTLGLNISRVGEHIIQQHQ